MSRWISFFISLTFFSSILNARVIDFGETEEYTFQKTPYKKCWSQEKDFQKIVRISLEKYLGRVEKSGKVSIFAEDLSDEGLNRIKKAAQATKDNIDLVNEYVSYLIKNHRSEWDVSDGLPDAFVLFAGGKANLNLGFGAGATVMGGVVMMPFCMTKVMKSTGKVIKTWDIDLDYIAWGGPNFGAGVGGGLNGRAGIGLIWNLGDDFYDPGQFGGIYAGTSSTVMFGMGVTLKAGVVKGPTDSALDFGYASAALEFGPAAEVSWHKNIYAILPASEILEMLGASYYKKYEQDRADLKREMKNAMKEVILDIKNERQNHLHFQEGGVLDPYQSLP